MNLPRAVTEDDVLMAAELRSRESTERVRRVLREEGRPDLIADLDAKMRDLASGVMGAQSAWHSISPAQRRVIEVLATGRWLVRAPASNTRYDAHGKPDAVGCLCSIATIRNLCRRELLHPDGPALDPEARFVLTERARFVLAHGRRVS